MGLLARLLSLIKSRRTRRNCDMLLNVTKLEALKLEHAIARQLLRINQMFEIHELKRTGEENTMVDPKVAALITQFDAATNAIAARIQALIDNGGLNADSEAALTAEVAKLTALGQDPNNPVPTT